MFKSILLTLFLSFNPYQSTISEIPQPEQETLVLTSINSEGYHFTNTQSDTGAFITLSEAINYHVSNLQVNDTVTMVFNQYGDITQVNGKEAK